MKVTLAAPAARAGRCAGVGLVSRAAAPAGGVGAARRAGRPAGARDAQAAENLFGPRGAEICLQEPNQLGGGTADAGDVDQVRTRLLAIHGDIFQYSGIQHAILVVVGFIRVEHPVPVRVLAHQCVHVRAIKQAQFVHSLEQLALALVAGLLHGVISSGGAIAVGVHPIQNGLGQIHRHPRQPDKLVAEDKRVAGRHVQVQLRGLVHQAKAQTAGPDRVIRVPSDQPIMGLADRNGLAY